MRASGANLCGEQPAQHLYTSGRRPFALSLAGAEIGGDVFLQPDFVAIGGITLKGATVRHSVWANGSKIRALVGQEAINCESVQIGKHFQLRGLRTSSDAVESFQTIGQINFLAARIDGELRIAGGIIFPNPDDKEFDGGKQLLLIWMAKLGRLQIGAEEATPMEIHGTISAQSTRIEHNCQISSSKIGAFEEGFEGHTSLFTGEKLGYSGHALTADVLLEFLDVAENLCFGGQSIAEKVDITGSVRLTNARIGGNLSFLNTVIGRPQRAHKFRSELNATSVRVEGDFILACEILGAISLARARIEGELKLGLREEDCPLRLLWLSDEEEKTHVDLSEAEIHHSLEVGAIEIRAAIAPTGDEPAPIVRMAALDFYPGWLLAEAHIRSEDRLGIVAYLVPTVHTKNDLILLDGTSQPIYDCNRRVAADAARKVDSEAGAVATQINPEYELLKNGEEARLYLKFFCAFVWSTEGSFRIIESIDELPPGSDDVLAKTGVEVTCKVIEPVSYDDHYIVNNACILYGGNLFLASFKIKKNNYEIEMLNDKPIADLSKIVVDSFARPFRFVQKKRVGSTVVPVAPDAYDTLSGLSYSDADLNVKDRVHLAWEQRFRQWPKSPIKLNLAGLVAGSLDDHHGNDWWKSWTDKPTIESLPNWYMRLVSWLEWQPKREWRELAKSRSWLSLALGHLEKYPLMV